MRQRTGFDEAAPFVACFTATSTFRRGRSTDIDLVSTAERGG
jgi:hypothetical protein